MSSSVFDRIFDASMTGLVGSCLAPFSSRIRQGDWPELSAPGGRSASRGRFARVSQPISISNNHDADCLDWLQQQGLPSVVLYCRFR
ncbi:hypothetical protein PGT21_007385 [Puccinia graminis f. sp. tritici]|uniref:Uncharacterized protein n=1 Tax=Puccinia graminis f. sp. tritici TaxID=56615 RepID=A0A5B0LTT4_PUCGR|nr:hypothetical protein PGT21_007385 [Puccinia graminis f. sp. tritici]